MVVVVVVDFDDVDHHRSLAVMPPSAPTPFLLVVVLRPFSRLLEIAKQRRLQMSLLGDDRYGLSYLERKGRDKICICICSMY